MAEWMCLGGPLHGQWRPASGKALAANRPDSAGMTYGLVATEAGPRVSYAAPPRPILYYPRYATLPGWRVLVPFYMEARIAAGLGALPAGTVLPGNVQGEWVKSELACRWCYGKPLAGVIACGSATCITALAMLAALEVTTAEDVRRMGNAA